MRQKFEGIPEQKREPEQPLDPESIEKLNELKNRIDKMTPEEIRGFLSSIAEAGFSLSAEGNNYEWGASGFGEPLPAFWERVLKKKILQDEI